MPRLWLWDSCWGYCLEECAVPQIVPLGWLPSVGVCILGIYFFMGEFETEQNELTSSCRSGAVLVVGCSCRDVLSLAGRVAW